MMKIALSSFEYSGIGICSDSKLAHLDYGEDLIFLNEDSVKLQVFLCCMDDATVVCDAFCNFKMCSDDRR